MVVLVADGSDDGGGCRGHRTQESFVTEAEQGLWVAAAARDDDDVDVGIGIELGQGRHRFGDAAISLDGDVDRAEPDLGPAQFGIAMHIFFGVTAFAGDESDHVWEERQCSLAGEVEQALCAERPAQALELDQLVAEAGGSDRRHREAEVAGLDEVVALHAGDDAVADGELVGDALEGARPHAERDRRCAGRVLHLAEDMPAAEVPRCDLAFDPHRVPLLDEIADRFVEPRDGGRCLG